jgi:hypothetical protein
MSRSTDKIQIMCDTAIRIMKYQPDIIDRLKSVKIEWVDASLTACDGPVAVPNITIEFKT